MIATSGDNPMDPGAAAPAPGTDEAADRKAPWLAAGLSLVVPGAGDFYAGSPAWGALFVAGAVALAAGAAWSYVAPGGSVGLGLGLIAALVVLWPASLVSAYRHARRRGAAAAAAEAPGAGPRHGRDPYLAIFLTLWLPGVGHLCLGRWAAGVALALVTVGLWVADAVVPRAAPFPFVIALAVWIAAACFQMRRYLPAGAARNRRALGWLCLLVLAVRLAAPAAEGLLKGYVLEPFVVPVGSMAPTLEPGDRIFAWKRAGPPARGDVIVFRKPGDGAARTALVKRVAAVGGETIEFAPSGVMVNGTRVAEGALGRLAYAPPPRFAAAGEPFAVPPGTVFVVGDNVRQSLDSRTFGPVPVENVIGKAYKRYHPRSRAGPIE